jgi:hypothetical protein
MEGPTSPAVPVVLQEAPAVAAAVPGEGDEGEVTASCRKVTICHRGKDLRPGLRGERRRIDGAPRHLRGDRRGRHAVDP